MRQHMVVSLENFHGSTWHRRSPTSLMRALLLSRLIIIWKQMPSRVLSLGEMYMYSVLRLLWLQFVCDARNMSGTHIWPIPHPRNPGQLATIGSTGGVVLVAHWDYTFGCVCERSPGRRFLDTLIPLDWTVRAREYDRFLAKHLQQKHVTVQDFDD